MSGVSLKHQNTDNDCSIHINNQYAELSTNRSANLTGEGDLKAIKKPIRSLRPYRFLKKVYCSMVTVGTFRQMALSHPGAVELPHFDRTSFRLNKKIFATLDEKLTAKTQRRKG